MAMFKKIAIVSAIGLFLAGGKVLAESTYGYSSAGGDVSASAHVSMKVTVPNLILLKVGSAGAVNAADLQAWTISATIPAGSVSPSDGDEVAVTWDGTEPTISESGSPTALEAVAWTNGSGAEIACEMGSWLVGGSASTAGPANSDFEVASTTVSGGGLTHPVSGDLGGCTTGSAGTSFSSNALAKSTWTYSIKGTATPKLWKAGVYTNTITYTASSV